MKIEISPTDQEIDICDDLIGHRVTERMISDFLAATDEGELVLEAECVTETASSDRVMKGLILRKTMGPTLLEVVDGYLVATGSTDSLEKFCAYFSFEREGQPHDAFLFDPIKSVAFTRPESRTGVISLKL